MQIFLEESVKKWDFGAKYVKNAQNDSIARHHSIGKDSCGEHVCYGKKRYKKV